nr:hypothetical protein [Tanacetum cinerariifolium]
MSDLASHGYEVHNKIKGNNKKHIISETKDLHTADYTQLYDFLKYNQKEVDDLKAERIAKIQDPLALMANSNNPYASPAPHQDQSPFNQNFLQQPMTNPEDITDPTTAMNMALALMAKAFKLNYSTPTNNNQRISSNLRNRQITQPGNLNGYNTVQNVRNQVAQNPRVQNVGNQNGLMGVQGNGNLVAVRAEGNAAGHNGNQIRCYNCRGKEEARIQLQAEEYDLMAAAADLDEIEEVNANCILMENLQQASTSGTQTDSTPVYDSDGSAEVHEYENYYNNEIFNMFTQEEQYTELLEPILESHQVPQNDNEVISERISLNLRNRQIAQPGNLKGYNAVQNVRNQVAQNPRVQNVGNQNGLMGVQGNGNLVAVRAEGNAAGHNGNQIRCYNYMGNQIGNGNLLAARAEGNAAGQNRNQIRCYNCRGVSHYARNCTVRPRRRDAAYLQTQLMIAQKEEAGIQLQVEEYDLMAAAADLDEIKEVNANCILMMNDSGDAAREVPINKTFHEQTDDELTEEELKQVEDDDQAI